MNYGGTWGTQGNLAMPSHALGTTGANDTFSNVPKRFAASVNVFTTDSPDGLNAV